MGGVAQDIDTQVTIEGQVIDGTRQEVWDAIQYGDGEELEGMAVDYTYSKPTMEDELNRGEYYYNSNTGEMEYRTPLEADGEKIYDSIEERASFEAKPKAIEVETESQFGGMGSTATVECVFTDDFDPNRLSVIGQPNIRAEIRIDTVVSGEAGTNHNRIFTGDITGVMQNEEGVITIEAMDQRHFLNKYTVRIQTPEEGIPADALVRNLLLGNSSPDTVTTESVKIESSSDPVKIKEGWGEESRQPLISVLQDIARRDGAFLYTDKFNVIHYEPMVGAAEWSHSEHLRITELEAGDQTSEARGTIAKSSHDSSGSSVFRSLGSKTQDTKATVNQSGSDAVMEKEFTDSSGQTYNLDDNEGTIPDDVSDEIYDVDSVSENHNGNLSARAAENVSVTKLASEEQSKEVGKILVVGSPWITIHDKIILDELPDYTSVPEGEYSVKKVKHKINADDGFLTTLDLSEDLEKTYSKIFSPLKTADKREERRNNNSNGGGGGGWKSKIVSAAASSPAVKAGTVVWDEGKDLLD